MFKCQRCGDSNCCYKQCNERWFISSTDIALLNGEIKKNLEKFESNKLNPLKLNQKVMKETVRLGILGGGQLGAMMCQAAKKLNIKTIVLSDDKRVQHKIILINLYVQNMKITKKLTNL